jgi:uncharacterized protein DUF2252
MAGIRSTIHGATRQYEAWLGRQTDVVRADLRLKHQKMAVDPFIFLRGTFYRWLEVWPIVCASLTDAPRVMAVGDLHLENFGTWRDAEGRLIWGINDMDEACHLPYLHDLVRLATSARLALKLRQLEVSLRDASEALLDGYRSSLKRGGRAIVLAERNTWLAQIAIAVLHDPALFWQKLTALPEITQTTPRQIIRASMPKTVTNLRVSRRVAGVGSLGRPRFVGVGLVGGSAVAREIKALVPSAAVWLNGGTSAIDDKFDVLDRAVRVPDPFFSIERRWVVRRLAPDCTKVGIDHLPRRRDHRKLLRAMGWETANLHLGSAKARTLLNDLDHRPRKWLEDAVTGMADVVVKDWKAWTTRR